MTEQLVKDEKTFTAKFGDNDGINDYCEWCGMMYPRGGWDYYEVKVFKVYHKICSDCKDQLTLVEYVNK